MKNYIIVTDSSTIIEDIKSQVSTKYHEELDKAKYEIAYNLNSDKLTIDFIDSEEFDTTVRIKTFLKNYIMYNNPNYNPLKQFFK